MNHKGSDVRSFGRRGCRIHGANPGLRFRAFVAWHGFRRLLLLLHRKTLIAICKGADHRSGSSGPKLCFAVGLQVFWDCGMWPRSVWAFGFRSGHARASAFINTVVARGRNMRNLVGPAVNSRMSATCVQNRNHGCTPSKRIL